MATYTPSMEQRLVDAAAEAPLNLARAQELAEELGVTYRSIISKASQLGLEYVKVGRGKTKSKTPEVTKSQLIQQIRETLELPEREGDLTKAEIEAILSRLSSTEG